MTAQTGMGAEVVTLLPGADHARPEAPMGATLSRRWRKREALIQERDRLMRAACGDWRERVREIDERLGEGEG